MQSLSKALQLILSSKKVAFIVHQKADADALCSMMALKLLVKKRKEHKVSPTIDLFTDTEKVPENCLPLVAHASINKQRYKKYDLAVSLDCASLSRLGRFQDIFNNAKHTIVIDHHDTCEKFAENNIVRIVSSVCEILYHELVMKRKWKVTSEICRLLYCGIITDTNDLTQNVHQSTHQVIADLMEKDESLNLELETLRNHFFKNSSKQQISLLQRALKSLQFFENDQIAIMKIFKQDLIETGCGQEDTLGIVDYALKMKGVYIGVIFIKQEDNSYYVSLRSKDNIDVSCIAKHFNGGGHFNVSAFQSSEPLAELKLELIAKCKEQLGIFQPHNLVADLFEEEL